MTIGARIVLLLLGLSLLGGAITGSDIYYRLAYVWILLYAGNWLWSAVSLRGLVLTRTARNMRAQLGQVFEERFDVRNPTRLPRLWLEVRDESTLPGILASQVFTQIGGQQSRSYIARTRLIRRGVFPLGPTVLASGDLFGMFPSQIVFPARSSLLVYPHLFEISAFPGPAGLISGGDALRRRTQQITPNASGVRDYAPGDSLNRIHWRTTARRDQLMVKEFELDPQSDVWLFVDAEERRHASQPWIPSQDVKTLWNSEARIDLPPSTEEYTASISASLARYFLRVKRSVGLVSHGVQPILLPSDRGGRQLIKILESMALWKADGDLPLLGICEAQARHLPRGSTVVLVTPSPDQEVALAADYLNSRGLRTIAVLIDSESFGGKPGARLLAERLKLINVIVRVIARGDHLEGALSSR